MLKLIGSPKARGFRVLWMLEELGLDYELDACRPHSESALAVNPSGKVPVLVDGDAAIIDSVASIQYLADRHGKFTAAAGTVERRMQDSFTCFALDELDGVLWTNAKHDFVLPEELRQPGIHEACAYDFAKAVKTLEIRLGDRSYVMGDAPSVPDFLITHCVGWASRAAFDWPAGPLTNYVERMRSRPAFVKASAIRDAS